MTGQDRGNPRAHRISHDIRPRDVEMIHQRNHILGHDQGGVELRLIKLIALSMPAIIERNDTKTSIVKSGCP